MHVEAGGAGREKCEEASEIIEGQPESSGRVQVGEVAGEGCGLVRHGFRGMQAYEEIYPKRRSDVRGPLRQDLQPDAADNRFVLGGVGVLRGRRGCHNWLRHEGPVGRFGCRSGGAGEHGSECGEKHSFKERCRESPTH